jgi:hypothetical protein
MRRTLLALVIICTSLAAEAKKRPADPAMIAAHSKFFGIENVDQRTGQVDPSRVIVSWITNASFAVAASGHVMLLDTYVTRLELSPGRTPFVIQDLVELQPEALFLGHGHFDHADNAAYIAQKTGAIIYASPETCDNMATDATNNFNNHYTTVATVTCVPMTSRGSLPGAEMVSVKQFEPDIRIQAFKHLHSTNTGDRDDNAVPIASPDSKGVCQPAPVKLNTFPCNLQDPRDKLLFPAGTPLEPKIRTSAPRGRAPGGRSPPSTSSPCAARIISASSGTTARATSSTAARCRTTCRERRRRTRCRSSLHSRPTAASCRRPR